jgi:hypothetical protein
METNTDRTCPAHDESGSRSLRELSYFPCLSFGSPPACREQCRPQRLTSGNLRRMALAPKPK